MSLAYFRFDDLLTALMINNLPRAPAQEGRRSASGTQAVDLAAFSRPIITMPRALMPHSGDT
jgi:hypothetical protein